MKTISKNDPNTSAKKRDKKNVDHENELLVARRLLQVEDALEKVRMKALKMKRSDELKEVIAIIFKEMEKLGFDLYDTNIAIVDRSNKDIIFYGSGLGGVEMPPEFRVPYLPGEEPYFDKLFEDVKSKKPFRSTVLKGKRLKDYHKFTLEKTEFKNAPKEYLEEMLSVKKVVLSYATMSHGFLEVASDHPLDDDKINILKRFSRVVDLTYTRFDDLQKAEAQAKEAQIEAALERVRSRSLAMHNTEELGEVASVVFEKLRELDMPVTDGVAIVTHIEGSKDQVEWMENPDQPSVIKVYQPYYDHPILDDYWKAKNKGLDFIAPRYNAEESRSFFNHIFEFTDYRHTPEEIKDYCLAAETYSYFAAFQKNSSIFINDFSGRALSVQEIDIVKRFSKVFEQAYVRFLDLKKAEAQAREAEIEAALERVRSRSMGMQKSEELKEVIQVVFEQLIHLKIDVEHAGFVVDYIPGGDWHFWIADKQQIPSKISHPYFDSVWAKQFDEAKEQGVDFFVTNLNFEEKNKFYKDLLSYIPDLSAESKEFYFNCPGLAASNVLMENVALYIENFSAIPYTDEENKILMRFGKVFQQTYTRFLDLQKAEAQTREAQIETALEKIRAQVTAMNESIELLDIVVSMHAEFTRLGHEAHYFWHMRWLPDKYEKALTNGDGTRIGNVLELPRKFHDVQKMLDWEKTNEPWAVFALDPETAADYIDKMIKLGNFQEIDPSAPGPDVVREMGGLTFVVARTTHGEIGYTLPGEVPNLPAEDISLLVRFAGVFDLAYRRFEDLKAAEKQNRETQIELSLERIRARTMAMQHSEELGETAFLLAQQVRGLGIKAWGCAFHIYGDDEKGDFEWFSNEEGYLPFYKTPRKRFFKQFYDKRESGETLLVKEFKGKTCENHYKFLLSLPVIGQALKDLQASGISLPASQIDHVAYFKFGYLLFITYEHVPEAHQVFKRFAREFEQTYTRFLDLKKAEEQAREAQIEAALERVRSRTMGMQRSEEMLEVGGLLYKELSMLGVASMTSGVTLVDKEDKMDWYYMVNPDDGSIMKEPMGIPRDETEVMRALTASWENQESYHVVELNKKETIAHQTYVAENSLNFAFSAEELIAVSPEKLKLQTFNFKQGYLLLVGGEKLSLDKIRITSRFANVFEQTYTRFLDLQKAEAQAREAQIEAALERVRARTMAMQKSEELSDVASLLFQQIGDLGIKVWTAGFNVWLNNDRAYQDWITSPKGGFIEPYIVDTTKFSVFIEVREAKQRGDEFFVQYVGGDKIRAMYEQLSQFAPEQFEIMLQDGFEFPKHQYDHFVFGSTVSLMFITFEPLPEAHDIFKRFGKVFEQTYTRFLDLQKAEAQAREAQIEAALERVRASSMAMHSSEGLSKVAEVLREQMSLLDQKELESCIVQLYNKGSEYYTAYYSFKMPNDPKEKMVHDIAKQVPWKETEWSRQVIEKYNSGSDHFTIHADRKMLKEWYQMLAKVSPRTVMRDETGELIVPEELYYYFSCFSGGFLSVITYDSPGDQTKELLNRAARTFDMAYKRFEDLKKAEAQAREAQIEAALERVRSRSMAMHQSEELNSVLSTMFAELTNLDFALARCVIWIFKEEDKSFTWYSANPEGEVESYLIPFTDYKVVTDYWDFWEKRIRRKYYDLSGDLKKGMDEYIFNHTEMVNMPKEVIRGMTDPEQVHLYNTFNDFGALLVSSIGPQDEEIYEILERFGNVFNQAFTRFKDIQKAEDQAREVEIQLSLERIRSRSMAMHQSEELSDVLSLLFKQFDILGINPTFAHLTLFDEKSDTFSFRMTGRSGERVLIEQIIDINEMDAWKSAYTDWKNEEEGSIVCIDYPPEVLPGVFEIMAEIFAALPKGSEMRLEDFPDGLFTTQGHCKFGYIGFNHTRKATDEEKEIVTRFAREFGLVYQRFLDLKKAEEQAREAQIEAALERIRSKALAMQSSADLLGVSIVLREQMGILGQAELESSIIHLYNEKNTFEAWYTFRSTETKSNKIVTDKAVIPKDSCKYIRETIAKYNSPEQDYTIVSKGKKLEEWYNVMVKVAPDTIEYDDKGKMIVPEILYYHYSKFSGGALLMISNQQPSDESKELQSRAAKVFNLAYQRFHDFQQAEARAKETIKQASLDRIRGEISSMRSVDDLTRITPLIWQELQTLNIPFIRCGVLIMDEQRKVIETHLSDPDGHLLGVFDLPFDSREIAMGALQHWRKGAIYKDHWDEVQFIKFTQNLLKSGHIESPELYQGAAAPPKSLDLHFLPFKQGMLYVGNSEPLTDEELQTAQSLANAFSIAYARYEDFNQLAAANNQIQKALDDLRSTQTQLVHAEKMASLGELTAGIAHEIQNPLNFVNNFSEVSKELIEELKEEMTKQVKDRNEGLENEIIEDIIQNLEKINHHGQRASSIVKGMLEHSRSGKHTKELTDINTLADEYLRLAYHGLRAKDKSFNADFKTELDPSMPKVNVIGQDIGRVLLNLINNAFYAVSKRSKEASQDFKPEVLLKTKRNDKTIEITVQDNGGGIPKNVLDKIFQPFFTTKPTGQGTGLGLSLSYDIITKGHDGHLEVETQEGIGTSFIIQIPQT